MKPNWKSRLFKASFWSAIFSGSVSVCGFIALNGSGMGLGEVIPQWAELYVVGASSIASAFGFRGMYLRNQDRKQYLAQKSYGQIDESEGAS